MTKIEEWLKTHKTISICGILFFLFIVSIIVGVGNTDTDKYVEENTNSRSVRIGEEGKLDGKGDDITVVCWTEEYYDEMMDTAIAKDMIGWEKLFYDGKCSMVSTLDDVGRVLVLDRKWGPSKIRFISEDALYYSEVAWINSEFVVPI